ncbi:phage late control D family protein [Rhizobium sp. SU303]|uniref:phage late control D family protein n=1 Tax=Rhizobium sp. SU303 TaxID=3138065 RepID=UPI001E47CF9E|nr:contractile injection system protein, VgrG/Pvc8 family [Rhizobium leguminosarum]UFW80034.1 late control protein D [Rhizobium leguminosarum bv. viciae]
MHPKIEVTIDGQPVAGLFYERLLSATVIDKQGVKADTVSIELNDGPPNFLAIPRTGAVISVAMGYGTARPLGRFIVDKVSPKCLPYSMSISGKSADFRSGKLKEAKERHWDNASLGDVVEQIAGENGLSSAVDPSLASFRYTWLGQQDESDLQLLHRLEKRHNGLMSIKGGRVVFAKRGAARSASGAFVGTVIITPDMIVQGSCSFEANDRTKYRKVVAYYQDRDKAQRVEIDADGDADGDSVYRIPEPYGTLEEADKAAQAKAKALKRGEGSSSVTVVGDATIIAGAPLLFQDVRPGLDGVPYIIDTATHAYSKASYTTGLSNTLYDGKSAGEDGDDGEAGEGSSGSPSGGKVAPNSPAGTPATPDNWQFTRRNGRTDEN